MAKRISVVVSQGQSQNPAKRDLEESIVTQLIMESGIDVTVVPHLYDLTADGTGMLAMKSINGNMVVVSWLFERAAHWILDRNGIHGMVGHVELKADVTDDDDAEAAAEEPEEKERVIDSRVIPNRNIYCLDLRVSNKPADFVKEIKRIQEERSVEIVSLGIGGSNNGSSSGDAKPASESGSANENGRPQQPTAEQLQRFENPTNSTSLEKTGAELTPISDLLNSSPANQNGEVQRIEDNSARRWYPVIDYSRCTNCMECIDFCLFGVYGVDQLDSILVEQPDNCRKGCPACSRVCPENAIIFPQHKTPAIAGSPEIGASLKIDLSKLFGAPDDGKSAEEIAALERDEQLLAVGREAVGMNVGMAKRQTERSSEPKDELDSLVDELDDLDL